MIFKNLELGHDDLIVFDSLFVKIPRISDFLFFRKIEHLQRYTYLISKIVHQFQIQVYASAPAVNASVIIIIIIIIVIIIISAICSLNSCPGKERCKFSPYLRVSLLQHAREPGLKEGLACRV